MMAGTENILKEETPDVTYAQGNTNTVLAGALAASRLQAKIGHVEAGLRSFDRAVPEEINRGSQTTFPILLFAPTETSRSLRPSEGTAKYRIYIMGNTVVDAVRENLRIAESRACLTVLGSALGPTWSRPYSGRRIDDPARLADRPAGVGLSSEALGLPVIMPMHPRTKKMTREHDVPMPGLHQGRRAPGIHGFPEVESGAALMMTDRVAGRKNAAYLACPRDAA